MSDTHTESITPHILILGGGFAGMYTYKKLLEDPATKDLDITIINNHDHFLFTPLLHEVATGALSSHNIVEPIRQLIEKRHRFVLDEVTHVDPETSTVTTKRNTYKYDYLVYSLGASTTFFKVPGAEEFSLELKTLKDAQEIRAEIVDRFEHAETEPNKKAKQKLLCFNVIGGGATGVELAAEMAEYIYDTLLPEYENITRKDISLTILNRGKELLQHFKPKMRVKSKEILEKHGVHVKTEVSVSSITADSIESSSGDIFPSSLTVWAAGVSPNNLIPSCPENKNRLLISNTLHLHEHPHVFVAGDAAHIIAEEGGPYPMLAQVATQQADIVAKNIIHAVKGEPYESFIYTSKGNLISLGQWNALGHSRGLFFKGPLAWLVWRTVYFTKFFSPRKKIKIALEWTLNIFFPRDITRH